jgi:hypothetical protein
MLDAIGDSLSDLASLDNKEDGEDDQDTEQGKLSEDDEPSRVMGTISKMVQQRMERFRQKQIKIDELTQPGWGDTADYFLERDRRYGTTELEVSAVVKSHMDKHTASPAPSTFGELMESLDIIPGISQMPHEISRPGSSQLRLGSGRTQSNKRIASLPPNMVPDLSPITKAKPVEPISDYCCIFLSS